MRLKELRARRLLTVRELAEKADMSPTTLSLIETGHGLPALRTIRKLSTSLAVEPLEVEEFRAAIEARGQG